MMILLSDEMNNYVSSKLCGTAAVDTVDPNTLLDKLEEWVELTGTVPNWETSS